MLALDKISIVCMLNFLRVSVFVDIGAWQYPKSAMRCIKLILLPPTFVRCTFVYVGLQVIPQWFHSVGLVTDDA